jgi:hypothetical protein
MSRTGATEYRDGGAYYTPPDDAHQIVGRWAPQLRQAAAELERPLRILDPSAGGGAFPLACLAHGLVGPGTLEVMDLDPAARALQLPGVVATVANRADHPVQTGFLITDPQQPPDLVLGNPPFGVPRPPDKCDRCSGTGQIVVRSSHRKLQRAGHAVGSSAPCPTCDGSGWRTYTRAIPVCREHVERSLEVSQRFVLLLLRLAMLEGLERAQWWPDTPLRHVDVLPSRPEFMAVCCSCAGTGRGSAPGVWDPPDCPTCDGTGRHGKSGGDATAYGAFMWDKRHTGPPTLGWLT